MSYAYAAHLVSIKNADYRNQKWGFMRTLNINAKKMDFINELRF